MKSAPDIPMTPSKYQPVQPFEVALDFTCGQMCIINRGEKNHKKISLITQLTKMTIFKKANILNCSWQIHAIAMRC